MKQMASCHFRMISSRIQRSRIAAAIGTAVVLLSAGSSDAALVNVSNVNSDLDGGYALFDESGGFLSDPPATIFIGGFDTYSTAGAIQTAFTTNFAALAADFVSIGSVGAEVNSPTFPSEVPGLHDSSSPDLDPTAVLTRNVAIWLTTSGTINDAGAEHLIYLTSQTFMADPGSPSPELSYSVLLRSGADGGNGTLAVGGFGNYSYDFMQTGGPGLEAAFNTVAVPEPSSVLLLSALGIFGIYFMRCRIWRRKKSTY